MMRLQFSAGKSLPAVSPGRRGAISIDPWAYFYFAVSLLILPIRWVLSWYLAAVIHELAHLTAIRLCGAQVRRIQVRCTGVSIETDLAGGWQECICALAGPVGSFFVFLLIGWMPITGFCALIQLAHNLLPMYPLDGGRVLRCMLTGLFSQETGERISADIGLLCAITIFAVGFYLSVFMKCGFLPLLFGALTLMRRVK